ncbi:MAG: PDZ domain-containing protein, partial [Bacteroidales bacterium]|nr:PDZ domain-containing protein [Bacteroidales bacterium]
MKFNKIFYIVIIILFSSKIYGQIASKVETQGQKFHYLINLIDNLYVDSLKVDTIVDNAISKMLQDLDPHSVYIKAADLKMVQEPLEGSFEGIGVSFRILQDTVVIMDIISGGPSQKLGILAGDRIVTVNDSVIAGVGMKQNDVPKLLRGKKGT